MKNKRHGSTVSTRLFSPKTSIFKKGNLCFKAKMTRVYSEFNFYVEIYQQYLKGQGKSIGSLLL